MKIKDIVNIYEDLDSERRVAADLLKYWQKVEIEADEHQIELAQYQKKKYQERLDECTHKYLDFLYQDVVLQEN